MGETSQEPLSPDKATKLIRDIVRYGAVELTRRCRKESMPERSISFQDLLAVLQNGEVKDPPMFNIEYRQFRYRVEGTTIEGDDAIAVTVIIDPLWSSPFSRKWSPWLHLEPARVAVMAA
jgi:hypothetical protein